MILGTAKKEDLLVEVGEINVDHLSTLTPFVLRLTST